LVDTIFNNATFFFFYGFSLSLSPSLFLYIKYSWVDLKINKYIPGCEN